MQHGSELHPQIRSLGACAKSLPIRPRCVEAERPGPANCPGQDMPNSLSKITPIMAWMSWHALRRFEVLPKATSACIDCLRSRRRARKTGLSDGLCPELPDHAAGRRRLPGAAGRPLEHDARHEPEPQPEAMRWRVGLQFLAIVIVMLLVYLLRYLTGRVRACAGCRQPATLQRERSPGKSRAGLRPDGRSQQDLHAHRRCRPDRARQRRARAQALAAHRRLRHRRRDQRQIGMARLHLASASRRSTPCWRASRTTCSISAPTSPCRSAATSRSARERRCA